MRTRKSSPFPSPTSPDWESGASSFRDHHQTSCTDSGYDGISASLEYSRRSKLVLLGLVPVYLPLTRAQYRYLRANWNPICALTALALMVSITMFEGEAGGAWGRGFGAPCTMCQSDPLPMSIHVSE